MNNLSWLIYLANTIENMAGFFYSSSIILFFVATILFVAILVSFDGDTFDVDRAKEFRVKTQKIVIWAIVGGIVFSFIVGFLPSRQTVLLIAASEVGERVINSEKLARVGDRMTAVIDPSIELLNVYIAQQTDAIRKEMMPKSAK